MTKPTKPGWYAILHEDRGNTLVLLTQDSAQGLRMLLPGDLRLHDPAAWSGEFVGPLDVRALIEDQAIVANVRVVLARWLEFANREDTPAELRRINRDFALELSSALQPRAVQPIVPWWKLRISIKAGPRAGRPLGNTTEFRQVIRSLLSGTPPDPGFVFTSNLCSCYQLDAASDEALRDGRVDWRWFPLHESVFHTWKPPAEMRAEIQAEKKS